RRTLRAAKAAVVGLEHDVAVAGKGVDVGDVAFRRAVYRRWDIAVVEDDHRPAAGGLRAVGNRQQRKDLEAVREIRGDVLPVIAAGRQRALDDKVAAGVIALPHGIDRKRGQPLRRRPRQGGRRAQGYGRRWRRNGRREAAAAGQHYRYRNGERPGVTPTHRLRIAPRQG